MKSVHQDRVNMPSGGIIVVLGGDFRQILLVIPGASRSQVVPSCITRSKLWDIVNLKELKCNMCIVKEILMLEWID